MQFPVVAISSSVGLSADVSISVGSDWRTSRQSFCARGFADYIWLVYILVFVGPTSASCYIVIVGLILCILPVRISACYVLLQRWSHIFSSSGDIGIFSWLIHSHIGIGLRAAQDHHQLSDRGVSGIVTLSELQFYFRSSWIREYTIRHVAYSLCGTTFILSIVERLCALGERERLLVILFTIGELHWSTGLRCLVIRSFGFFVDFYIWLCSARWRLLGSCASKATSYLSI